MVSPTGILAIQQRVVIQSSQFPLPELHNRRQATGSYSPDQQTNSIGLAASIGLLGKHFRRNIPPSCRASASRDLLVLETFAGCPSEPRRPNPHSRYLLPACCPGKPFVEGAGGSGPACGALHLGRCGDAVIASITRAKTVDRCLLLLLFLLLPLPTMGFGEFESICHRTPLPLCSLVGPASSISGSTGIIPSCYARNIELANTIIFEGAASFLHIIALAMTVIMVLHVRSKFTAVGMPLGQHFVGNQTPVSQY